ncbi:S-locus glycoprotein [Trema orientale]|uniref:non-specific serine/threonine protein kinase n=1 Tax=Trema orientale TaxID=63057 RepID=A0A2P5AU99_TREOI|nr:S-locus glycoprotein [Trema orientale]
MNLLSKHWLFLFAIFGLITLTTTASSSSVDSLSSIQSLTNDQTLVSAGQVFELGLFKPGSSGWYLGIWYKKIPVQTVVWVANRDTPLSNSSATLKFRDRGSIVLLDSTGNLTWSSNQTGAIDPVLQLLDSGNLVVRDQNDNDPDKFLWQSFDSPTDTLLPDMKLGWDLRTGLNRNITSWKSSTDPSTGDFSFDLNYRGFPEIFLREKQRIEYRSGPWNGERFSGVPEMNPVSGLRFEFVTTQQEVYYSFSISQQSKSSMISRLFVNPSGNLERYTWIESSQTWNRFWYAPKDQCDSYMECGPYGVCDSNASPVCQCPKGFAPKNLQAWNLRDGSDGCVRKTELECGKDKFLMMKQMKLPQSSTAFVDRNMTLDECRKRCLENCSCTAYANADVSNGGSGCVTWSGDLIDLRNYAEGGQVLFLRLAASDLDNDWTTKRIIIIVASAVGICILLLGLCLLWKRKALLNMCKAKKEVKGTKIFSNH